MSLFAGILRGTARHFGNACAELGEDYAASVAAALAEVGTLTSEADFERFYLSLDTRPPNMTHACWEEFKAAALAWWRAHPARGGSAPGPRGTLHGLGQAKLP